MKPFAKRGLYAAVLCAAPVVCASAQLDYDIAPETLTTFDVATDTKTLYAVGERGVVLTRTKAEGSAWKTHRLPTTKSLTSMAVSDRSKVIVGYGGTILRSDTDSDNWTMIGAEELTYGDPLMDVVHLGDDRFISVGAFGLALLSEDGGRTWNKLTLSEEYFDRHLYSIMQAGNAWILIGESGSLFKTEDLGQSWAQMESPYTGSFFGGLQTPGGAWVLYGMRGQVWRSENQGDSWTKSRTGIELAINAHGVAKNGDVYLLGNSGEFLASGDDGKTFRRQTRAPQHGDITSASRINGKWLISGTRGVGLAELGRGE